MTLFDVSELFGVQECSRGNRWRSKRLGTWFSEHLSSCTCNPKAPAPASLPPRQPHSPRSRSASASDARRRRKPSGSAGASWCRCLPTSTRESRQRTVDWLVERLLTPSQPAVTGWATTSLLARAIELSDRYLVGTRPVSVRRVTNQSACLGFVLERLGRHPHLTPPAGGARLGARLGADPRGGPPDAPGPLPCLPPPCRHVPATTKRRACSWPVTAWGCRLPPRRPAGAFRRGRRPASARGGAGSRSPRPASARSGASAGNNGAAGSRGRHPRRRGVLGAACTTRWAPSSAQYLATATSARRESLSQTPGRLPRREPDASVSM